LQKKKKTEDKKQAHSEKNKPNEIWWQAWRDIKCGHVGKRLEKCQGEWGKKKTKAPVY